ncbi:MAG: serpin family protein [Thermoflexales bacterium]|nr:serpin family protein [Thermoflexales bacterium]
MKSIVRYLLISSLLLSGVAGCVRPGDRSVQVARADVARVTQPDVPAQDLTELVNGNNSFAFDLYRALREGRDGNLFYSPFSISIALAMTWAGARGETERQMAETLHFTLPQDRLHAAFNALDLELAQRGQGARGKDGKGFRLHIVNALWGQQGYQFLPPFLETLARNYDAGLRLLDFAGDPEAARGVINDWVSDQTESRIRDLLPPGTIDALTRLVLTNAIYFNAAWAEPFDPKTTRDGVFHLLDGRQVTVPMMRQTANYGYGAGEGFQVVELPYDGNELAMVILLPDAGRFEEFENSLDAERVDEILRSLAYGGVTLTMPRFRVESDFRLADTLAAMGMPAAFQPGQADFSGMDGSRDLYISAILHKAFVDVDESGTEAAAATAVVIGLTAFIPRIEVTVDRPFIFLIRDLRTGTILFVGRVLNPAS